MFVCKIMHIELILQWFVFLEIQFIYFCKLVEEGQLSGLEFNSTNEVHVKNWKYSFLN